MPVIANIKMWLYGAVVLGVGALFALLKIKSVKLDLAQEKIKAKDAYIKNMAKAVKVQNETEELSRYAQRIREEVITRSRADKLAELRKP